jgi:hypothetical protein
VYDIQREVDLLSAIVSGRRGRRREAGKESGEWERLSMGRVGKREEEEM